MPTNTEEQYRLCVLKYGADAPVCKDIARQVRAEKNMKPSRASRLIVRMPKSLAASPRGSPLQLFEPTGEATEEGRLIYHNSEGGISSELSITIQDAEINDGRWSNIPSIFGGQIVSDGEAIEQIRAAGGVDPETGQPVPGFDSRPAAEAAAGARSQELAPAVEEPPPLEPAA